MTEAGRKGRAAGTVLRRARQHAGRAGPARAGGRGRVGRLRNPVLLRGQGPQGLPPTGIPLTVRPIFPDYMVMLRNPRAGYGKTDEPLHGLPRPDVPAGGRDHAGEGLRFPLQRGGAGPAAHVPDQALPALRGKALRPEGLHPEAPERQAACRKPSRSRNGSGGPGKTPGHQRPRPQGPDPPGREVRAHRLPGPGRRVPA